MAKLNWISDLALKAAVSNLLKTATAAKNKAENKFGKNVIDPFSAIFEMAGFGMTYDEWIISEKSRQAQKTLQNVVGEFHQTLLGSCVGWKNMGKGNIIDLYSADKKIIAEVKNKYNTISGGKLADLYWSLEDAVTKKTSIYKRFTAYYVSIIPNKPERFDELFTPSDKEKGQKCPDNDLIREIDGASFYSLVTNEKNALENLYDVLPVVINEITGKNTLDKAKLKGLFKMAYG
jgi:hypothetical protein